MKTIKIADATPLQIDWLVAKCERQTVLPKKRGGMYCTYQEGNLILLAYSTDWAQGGPIIEREKIELSIDGAEGFRWWGQIQLTDDMESGPTPLVAAMRVYVASKLGDAVDVPEELL